MKTHHRTRSKQRVSLEQKVRLLVKRYRLSERGRIKATHEHKRHCWSESPLVAAGLSIIALMAFCVTSFAAPATSFETANTAFAAGNYPAAITQYEAIIANHGYSAPVLFDLGNAYYREGQFGPAILNYERAQVLAPRDAAIAANLRLAQEKAGVPAPALSELQRAAHDLSPNTLAWIGSIALAAIWMAILGSRLFPHFTQARAVIGVAAVALLTVAGSLAIRWPEFDSAIVVATPAPARLAPAGTAAELFTLKAGQAVTVVKSYGQFILVRTPDGRAGWVGEKEIGRVFNETPNV